MMSDQVEGATVASAATGSPKEGSTTKGALFVFEGPDGVGKTTLVGTVHRMLSAETVRTIAQLAFPGREPGTLGNHVYQLHHDPSRFGIRSMTSASLQLLHVAAHLDAIDTLIRPRVKRGEVVLLDRYWWSTWVYGITNGADARTLRAMVELERSHWADLRPDIVFLIERSATPRRDEARDTFERLSAEYALLANEEAASTRVLGIHNNGNIDEAAGDVLSAVQSVLSPRAPA